MNAYKYFIARKLTKEECPWLNRTIEAGTTMYLFTGCTYGCISDNGRALTFNPSGESPFVEIPKDALSVV